MRTTFFHRWILPSLLVFAIAFAGMLFSHHGLLDLRRFQRQVEGTRQTVSRLEDENRQLRRELDLLQASSIQVKERKAREVYGWAQPGEQIFLEK